MTPEVPNSLWENLLEDTVTLSFAGVPVAIGFAVRKYRLYDKMRRTSTG